MPRTLPLAESRSRAERAFVMREVLCMPWSQIRDELGYRSHGAAQLAVKRYTARNPLPSAQQAAAGIVARKRAALNIAWTSMAAAQQAGDHRTVAQLLDAITRADAELARLFSLGGQSVDVNVQVHQTMVEIVSEAKAKLMAAVDAEVIEEPKGIAR